MRPSPASPRRIGERFMVLSAVVSMIMALLVVVAEPAHAWHPIVSGDVECDESTGQKIVTWSVDNSEKKASSTMVLSAVSYTDADLLSEIRVGAQVHGKNHDDHQALVDTTAYAASETEVKTLTVVATWVDSDEVVEKTASVDLGEIECEEVGGIELDLAEVSVTGACVEDVFVVTVASANASVNVDLNADGDFEDSNEVDTADGEYEVEAAGEVDWEASAHADAEFAGGVAVKSGSVTILECDEGGETEVGGIQIQRPTLGVQKSATQNGLSLNAINAATIDEAIAFTVTITNTSSETVEIISLDDDVFGALGGDADCTAGTILGANASCSFTFVTTFDTGLSAEEWASLMENEEHTNVVTVIGEGASTSADVTAEAELTFPVITTEVAGIVVTAPTTTTLGPVTPIDTGADAEVLAAQVGAAQVEAEQLPFTGVMTDRLIGLAIVLLGGGALLLRLGLRRQQS